MAIKKRPVSPRQKMINLMYVVLMAMLALNVSNEVLDGFSRVEESLHRTAVSSSKENQVIYNAFERQMLANPTKTKPWYDKAQEVRRISDSLYVFADMLKTAIARESDGEGADVNNIRNKEDLEAASQVMLSPTTGKGDELFAAINAYREKITSMVEDPVKREIIASNLSTDVPSNIGGKHWKEYLFESMPTAAAVTMLSKLQSDIRYAEGEVLHSLIGNVDEKDVRVNSLSAFVIPNSQTIVRGNRFSANIVMAAIDSTQTPDIYIGGKRMNLSGNLYETVCSRAGDFTLEGYIELLGTEDNPIRRAFSQKYTVVEPTATVSADMMNVLYAGYGNPISVSVPGVPLSKVSATATGGEIRQTGQGKYIIKPSKVGQNVTVSVFSSSTGKNQQMAEYSFKVRKLPEPSPFIRITDEKGNADRYRGGGIAKSQLLASERIGAAIDDGILDVPFKVLSFETVFFDGRGNAVPMASDGERFSQRQLDTFRKLAKGKRFYVSRITAIGPDGLQRKLNTSMEVIVR